MSHFLQREQPTEAENWWEPRGKTSTLRKNAFNESDGWMESKVQTGGVTD